MRWPRRRPTFVVLSTLTVLLIGAYGWSRTSSAASLVGRKLEGRLGAPVRVERLDVGFSASTLRHVRMFEVDGDESELVLTAGSIDANVSPIGALTGSMPREIVVRDAELNLRFDRQGNLLSRFPTGTGGSALRSIRIESGSVVVNQVGRAPTTFRGLNATITGSQIQASADDPEWGQWKGEGTIDAGRGRFTMSTVRPRHITTPMLQTLPFLNPNAWQHFTIDGTTPCTVELTIDATTESVGYRVSLEPTGASLVIPAINAKFSETSGKVVAQDDRVTLKDVRGRAADGWAKVDGQFDFSRPDDSLQFQVQLDKLAIRNLPPEWKVPEAVDGRVSGAIDLGLVLPKGGGQRLLASGKATISPATLNGRAVPPVEVVIRTSGEEIQFRPAEPLGQPKEPAPLPKIDAPKRGGYFTAVMGVARQFVKPGAAPPVDDQKYVTLNLAFRDVDLAELLAAANVKPPVPIAGKATLQVELSVPTDRPDDFKSIRLKGTIQSPQLQIDELTLRDVSAKLNLRDGSLQIEELAGRLPGGAFVGSGKVQAEGEYPFEANIKFEKAALRSLEKLKGLVPVESPIDGELELTAQVTGTLSPAVIKATGTARVPKLTAGETVAENVDLRWAYEDRVIRVIDARASLLGGELAGTLDVPIDRSIAGGGNLRLTNLDIGALAKSLVGGAQLQVEGKANGSIKIKVPPVTGNASRVITADVDLQAPTMNVRLGTGKSIPAKKVRGSATYANGELDYKLSAEALGGEIILEPPSKKAPPKKVVPDKQSEMGMIRFRRVVLSRAVSAIGIDVKLGQFDAEISGEVDLAIDDAGKLIGGGRLRIDRARWGLTELASGSGTIKATESRIVLEDLLLSIGSGYLRAYASIDRNEPDRSYFRATLAAVPSSKLLFAFPELASKIDLLVDGRIVTSLGREWRGVSVLTGSRGKIYGLPVTDVRLPLDWSMVPSLGRAEVRLREATLRSSGGQIGGKAQINLFADLPPRLSGEVTFRNANVSQAIGDGVQGLGNLPITGQFDFSADQLRTIEDLSGTLQATVGESPSFSVPLLAAILPYISGLNRDTRITINEGEVRATLGRGVWRVQRVTLVGPSIDLYADGTLTTSGRLNLNVVASSASNRPGEIAMRRLRAIPLTATQPLGPTTVTSAMGVLSNYVVYMEVSGTTDVPTVRLQTLRTVSEAAIRFFALRFLGT